MSTQLVPGRTSPEGTLGLDVERAPTSTRQPSRSLLDTRVPILGVIVAGSAWMLLLVSKTYFISDDFVNLGLARFEGLHWSYLSRSVYGHFIPGFRLAYWVLAGPLSANYRWVEAFAVVLFAMSLWLFSEVCLLLFGQRRAIVFATAAFGCSLLLTPSLLWFASLLETLPATAASLLCLYAYLRWRSARTVRWLVVLSISFCVGLSFYEIMLVLPFVLAALELLVLRPRPDARPWLAALWQQWPAWLCVAIPGVVYVTYYATHAYGTGSPTPTAGVAAGSFVVAWFQAIGPTFLGYSNPRLPTLPPPRWGFVLGGQLIVLAVIGVALWHDARRTLRALTIFAVCFVAYLAPMALTRSGSWGTRVGRDFLYLTPFAWLIPLCALLAWFPLRTETASGRAVHRRTMPAWLRGSSVALAATFLGVSVVGQWSQMATTAAPNRDIRGVASNFIASVNTLDREHRNYFVFDGKLPHDTLPPYLELSFDLVSETLGPLAPPVTFSSLVANGREGFAVRPDGRLMPSYFRPAAILSSNQLTVTNGRFCAPGRRTTDVFTFTAAPGLPRRSWMIGLSSSLGSPGLVQLGAYTKNGNPEVLEPLTVRSGHTSYLFLTPTTISRVVVGLPRGGRFCGALEIGEPVAG